MSDDGLTVKINVIILESLLGNFPFNELEQITDNHALYISLQGKLLQLCQPAPEERYNQNAEKR